ncbi:Ig-like protein, group 1 [Alteromonas sp. ASW11-36]|uniref:Ig-like protein, group 1 n=1 Tax=Alteromonas arenosi TaxID=3055817 RepID=A0ABT7SSE7_9ALTE|nr:Ig-like protein, group 1 [Alteromonas sp. ASW11-36]MDM7859123.1 Ig-like protein, group 1 [Alteromonas sp. ASW11-36]
MLKKLALIAVLGTLLSACNGSSGENGESPFDGGSAPVAPVTALQLSVLDANCDEVSSNSFTTEQTACLEALLTRNGAAVSNEIITFSSGIGSLDVASKLTGSDGIARVFLSSDGQSVGAATINASFDSVQAQAAIEFLSVDGQNGTSTTIALQMLNQNGEPTQRFRANQQVRLRAVLTDATNTPIANEILSFSASRGLLPITDALTNSSGIAEVVLNGDESNIGAAIATVTLLGDDTGTLVDTINYEIQSVDAVEEDVVRIGYFDSTNFLEGVIGVNGIASDADVTISAGATLGLQVGLADSNDQPIVGSTPISFTSSCVLEQRATIDASVSTVNGRASSTYEDINCAGGSGNDDIISATVIVNNSPITISRTIELLPESIGSIQFLSASPNSIVLQGTGGQGSASVSTVTFQVNGELGNPLAQQAVNFVMSTNVGGLTLSPLEGLTNSEGQVSTRVTAGNVPTAVRVLASVVGNDNQVISTQSDLLTVNTGLPDQNSFSLSTSNPNPEAAGINGQQVNVTAYLADSFNNPVPDGTAVAFTTEGGQIEPSCTTTNGNCTVQWTSADPRVEDHRITILATAIGHETLFDSNGNNVFDDSDGDALDLGEDSGFNIVSSTTTGFSDISEAWRDDNENDVFDVAETFLDFDGSGDFTSANGLFDGPQCQAGNCGASGLHVRRAIVMVMASSNAIMRFFNGVDELTNNQGGAATGPVLSIPRGESVSLQLLISDTADQTLPSDTNVQITASAGTLTGETAFSVSKNNRAGGATLNVVLTNSLTNDQDPIDATVTATVTTPSGVVTTLTMIVSLD